MGTHSSQSWIIQNGIPRWHRLPCWQTNTHGVESVSPCVRKASGWDRSLAHHNVTLNSNQVYFTLLFTFHARASRSFVLPSSSLCAEAGYGVCNMLELMVRVCALSRDIYVSRGNAVKHFILQCNVQLKRLKETDLLCLRETPNITEAASF